MDNKTYTIIIEVTLEAEGLNRSDVWEMGKQICTSRLKGLEAQVTKVHAEKIK